MRKNLQNPIMKTEMELYVGSDAAEAFMCALAYATDAIGRSPGARAYASHLNRIV